MATSFEPVSGQLKAQFVDFEVDLSFGELIRDSHRFRLQVSPSLWDFLSGHMYSDSLGLCASVVSQCSASFETTISNQFDQSKTGPGIS
jgi:hypothetical protein